MSKGILIETSLRFSAKIIKLQQYLIKQKKETIILKQIIRSATSIGANINEANYGSSKQDFIAKMHIALKECAETEYWIRLLKEAEYIDNDYAICLLNDCLSINLNRAGKAPTTRIIINNKIYMEGVTYGKEKCNIGTI